MVNGKIQAFPWLDWKEEFPQAETLGLHLMEWTLDQEKLEANPFNSPEGQREILKLMQKFDLKIPSLTGDNFMQAPFYKCSDSEEKNYLLKCLDLIIESCSKLQTRYIVLPLVDNGSIKSESEKEILLEELLRRSKKLREKNVVIIFESDLPPAELAEFISNFPSDVFGINYDCGNSASLGFRVREEFKAYSHRILNIHIKDRILGGTTVPLGTGNADFSGIFECIKHSDYRGNLILQTARDAEGNHKNALQKYVQFVLDGLK